MSAAISPRRRGLFLAAVAVTLATAMPAAAQWGPPAARSNRAVLSAYKEVVAAPGQSTVRVHSDGEPVALGTIVAADGWIVTKASLLRGKLTVKHKDGKSYPATLVGVEVKHDLAMLRITAKGLKPIAWAHSKTAEVGNLLAAPGMGELPVAIGVVSVATRKPSVREMTMMAPSPHAGFMGVTFAEDASAAVIGSVVPDGPAQKAGVLARDVILRVQGKQMTDADRVIEAVYAYKPGDTITLRVQRKVDKEVQEKVLKVKLGRRPGNLFNFGDMNLMGSDLSGRRGGFPTILQHDAVIKPGDCGGPLVDLDGKAVGINIARAGRTESYAIPSEAVQGLLTDLKSGKLAPPSVINEEKIEALENTIRKTRTELREANGALQDEEDEAKKKALRDKVAALRKKISATQDEVNKLKGDPTKRENKKKN